MSRTHRRDGKFWLGRLIQREALLFGLLLAALAVSLLDPRSWLQTVAWLNLPVLASLTGLLAVAQGVRISGVVQRLARVLVFHMHTQRTVAGALLALSGLLAMVLTNDVALFLIVPLTLALSELVELPRCKLVVFEAMAVNAGSALSPIGNPQNLLLWQHSGVPMWSFVGSMFLPVLIMTAVLAMMTVLVFRRTEIRIRAGDHNDVALDSKLALLASVLLLLLIVLLEAGHAMAAAVGVLLVLGGFRPQVIRTMDWALIATIALLFVLLGHLASLPVLEQLLATPDWQVRGNVVLGGVLLSQIISNVPASIVLLDRVPDTLTLAAAVNIGGAGLAIGSLANLIALRLEGSRRIWCMFHLYSIPYLLVVLPLVWLVI